MQAPFPKKRFARGVLILLALPAQLAFTRPEGSSTKVDYEYTAEGLASISRGKPLYSSTCATCHNETGLGNAPLAPTLAGTDWVTGSKERLALTVGQGLTGPIEVNEKLWNQAMPAYGQHPDLSGENLNDLLNYIRASWDNKASLYRKGEARSYLDKHSDRNEPWITEEFEDLGLAPTL